MKSVFVSLVFLLTGFSRTFSQPTLIGGPILNPANGSTYFLLSTSSWTAAQAEAKALGGNLATIRNQAEHDFIYNVFGNFNGTPHHLWIGLFTTNTSPTGFRWVSGELLTYTHWASGEPNNCGGSGENRGIIFSPAYPVAGFWNDVTDSGIGGCGGGDLAPLGVVEVSIRATIAFSAVDVCWPSLNGHDYQLEYRTNSMTTNWIALGSAVSANSTNTCITDRIYGQPARFYRVRQLN
jgi:hypothetical protein